MTLPSPRTARPAHRAAGEPREDPRPKAAPPGRHAAPVWADAPSLATMRAATPSPVLDAEALLDELDELLAVTR